MQAMSTVRPEPGRQDFVPDRQARPLVTILMPAFEAEAWIGDAVAAALAQSWQQIEVVVAPDDGHAYAGLRARCTDPRLRILAPGPHRRSGPGPARNRAIDAARGEFFTMLDTDDLIPPNHVSDLMRVALRDGAAIAPTRYTDWDVDRIIRISPTAGDDSPGSSAMTTGARPPAHDHRSLTLKTYSLLLASLHPLQHRSLEPGYCSGFAEDVVHDGFVLARCGSIRLVGSTAYLARRRPGSLCNSGPEAEQAIRASYDARIEQILHRPTELGLQVLDARDREDFAELFRLRRHVSERFPAGATDDYQTWIAGREALLYREYLAGRTAGNGDRAAADRSAGPDVDPDVDPNVDPEVKRVDAR